MSDFAFGFNSFFQDALLAVMRSMDPVDAVFPLQHQLVCTLQPSRCPSVSPCFLFSSLTTPGFALDACSMAGDLGYILLHSILDDTGELRQEANSLGYHAFGRINLRAL